MTHQIIVHVIVKIYNKQIRWDSNNKMMDKMYMALNKMNYQVIGINTECMN